MIVCSIQQCSSRKNANQPKLTFHRFPKKEVRRRKWLELIGTENINPHHCEPRICSLHFKESAFNRTLSVVRLRDDAVPEPIYKERYSSESSLGSLEDSFPEDSADAIDTKDINTKISFDVSIGELSSEEKDVEENKDEKHLLAVEPFGVSIGELSSEEKNVDENKDEKPLLAVEPFGVSIGELSSEEKDVEENKDEKHLLAVEPFGVRIGELSSEEKNVDENKDEKYLLSVEPFGVSIGELSSEEKNVEEKKDKKHLSAVEWVIKKRLCRCCHAEGNFSSLLSEASDDASYLSMLRTCFNIELLDVSGAGAGAVALRALCGFCAARLRDAHEFCSQVRAAEARFQQLYAENCIKVAGVINVEVKLELTQESDDGDIKIEDDVFLEEIKPKQQNVSRTYKSSKNSIKKEKRSQPPTVGIEYSTKVGDSYKCKKCDIMFQKRSEVELHYNSIHKKRRKKFFKCKYCQEKLKSPVQLTIHKLQEHNIDERYKCNACDKVFNEERLRKRHENSYHMLGEKLKCSMCDYECYNKEPLRKHMFNHKTSKDYHCKYCNKAFLRKTTLKLHEKIHTGDKRKACAECGKAFVQKASLNYHMTKYHPEISFK